MEWFWQMVERLQKSVAVSALRSFSSFDWIVLIALFWGLIQGSRKGFGDMFGRLLGTFLVTMLTLSFYSGGAVYLHANLPVLPLKVAEPFVFFLLSVFLWISVSLCINVCGKFIKIKVLGFSETWGGMVFGGLRMMLLLSFIAQFLLLLPIEPVQQSFKQGRTYTGSSISRFAPALHEFVMSPFRKPVSKKIATSVKVGG